MNEHLNTTRRKRTKRRFRPLRRLLLLLVVIGLGLGVVSLSQVIYRRVFPPVRYSQAMLVDQPLLSGMALVLRDEVVMVADRSGVLNQLRGQGEEIRTGDVVFEIVDVERLQLADRQIREEQQAQQSRGTTSPEELSRLEGELMTAKAALRDLSSRYAQMIRQNNAAEAGRVFDEITRAYQLARDAEEEYTRASQTQDDQAARQLAFWRQRQQAIFPALAPSAGIVNYALDGRENQLTIARAGGVTAPDLVNRVNSIAISENMSAIVAGQTVASIVNPASAVLVLPASEIALDQPLEVAHENEVFLAELVSGVPGLSPESGLLALRVLDPSPRLLTSRRAEISVRPRGEVLVSVPRSAVLTGADGSYVYVQMEDGSVEHRPVTIRETRRSRVTVTGVAPEAIVIANPRNLPQERDGR